jgi:hypothetical protein
MTERFCRGIVNIVSRTAAADPLESRVLRQNMFVGLSETVATQPDTTVESRITHLFCPV